MSTEGKAAFFAASILLSMGGLIGGAINEANMRSNYELVDKSVIRECELNLPRTEHCELIATPVNKD